MCGLASEALWDFQVWSDLGGLDTVEGGEAAGRMSPGCEGVEGRFRR